MRLIELEVHNLRGIKHLKVEPNGGNLLIYGPNGSGKSGIVDAIDFLLTGKIARLSGDGTKDITLKEHGAHISAEPKDAWVKATFSINGLKEHIHLERNLKTAGKLKYPEKHASVLAPILEAAGRGNYVLSRRELLKVITADGATRAQQIQGLLNIPDVETTRKTLQKLESKVKEQWKNAKETVEQSKQAIFASCEGASLEVEVMRSLVNTHRTNIGLQPAKTDLDWFTGISVQPNSEKDSYLFAKQVAGNLLKSTTRRDDISSGLNELTSKLLEITKDLAAFRLHKRMQLTQLGQIAVEEDKADSCPLCDMQWDHQELTDYLAKKIKNSASVIKDKESIEALASGLTAALGTIAEGLKQIISEIQVLPELTSSQKIITDWLNRLNQAITELKSPIENYPFSFNPGSMNSVLAENGHTALSDINDHLQKLAPNESEAIKSQVFLHKLSTLWQALNMASLRMSKCEKALLRATAISENFLISRDAILNQLFASVNDRFVELYRYLNSDNEGNFTSELRPETAAIILKVDFFGYGMHPPHALHSEGHQDSMGLFLYLALMEKLTEQKIDIVVLDDVVMSVDADHRRLLCELLVKLFQKKQFIITTHDRVWASFLSHQGLIASKNRLSFTGWDVENGPHISNWKDIWSELETSLEDNKVPEAAAKLRRWGEEFFSNCCHNLKAPVVYKSHGSYDFGDFFSPAIGKLNDLLKLATKAATSWDQKDRLPLLEEIKTKYSDSCKQFNIEQAAINPNVHYNKWATHTPAEFRKVVQAYQNLHENFLCKKCSSLLTLTTEGALPLDLRCACSDINWNLKCK